MTGRQLYDHFEFQRADQGVEIDQWDEMEESERAAWDSVARCVNAVTVQFTDDQHATVVEALNVYEREHISSVPAAVNLVNSTREALGVKL